VPTQDDLTRVVIEKVRDGNIEVPVPTSEVKVTFIT